MVGTLGGPFPWLEFLPAAVLMIPAFALRHNSSSLASASNSCRVLPNMPLTRREAASGAPALGSGSSATAGQAFF